MNDRTILSVIVTWIAATIVFFFTSVSLIQYLSVTALLVLGTGVYYAFQREILTDIAQQTRESKSSDKAIDSLEIKRIEKTLDEYSKHFYSEGDQIDVRWDLADHDMAPLDTKGEEALLSVTGALGQNDRKIQVFIHLPSYKIPTHKRIRAGSHQEKYPFKYCDYYQENNSGGGEDLQQIAQQNRYPRYYRPQMAPNSQFSNTQPGSDEEGEE